MIANKATSVSAAKSVSEIQGLLQSARVSSVLVQFEDGKAEAISFSLRIGENDVHFLLPANWQGVLAAMKRDKSVPQRLRNEDQARRVSWRVIREWLRAQLTLIEAGASTIEEVMLPWAIGNDGRTMSQRFLGPNGLLGLPAPKRPSSEDVIDV